MNMPGPMSLDAALMEVYAASEHARKTLKDVVLKCDRCFIKVNTIKGKIECILRNDCKLHGQVITATDQAQARKNFGLN